MTLCAWCEANPIKNGRGRFCSQKCRQTAFRLRQRGEPLIGPAARPLVFGYADPPYLGLSARYYSGRANYHGEVDHQRLIRGMTEKVRSGRWAGWALSCSARSLRTLLPICPTGVDVCAWGKAIGTPPASIGRHSTWEAVLVFGGRQRPGGARDWLLAQPARGGGTLPGRKPVAFCSWLFGLLGMLPGDELVDLFPGSGVVARAWKEASSYQIPLSPSPTSKPTRGDAQSFRTSPKAKPISPAAR